MVHLESPPPEGFEEYTRQLGAWKVVIVLYKVELKHTCIVRNCDPQADICRVTGTDRERIVRSALEQAAHLLSRTVIHDVPKAPPTQPARIARIVYQDRAELVTSTVEQFLDLPIPLRMSHILGGTIRFFLDDGTEIDGGRAIKLLSEAGKSRV